MDAKTEARELFELGNEMERKGYSDGAIVGILDLLIALSDDPESVHAELRALCICSLLPMN